MKGSSFFTSLLTFVLHPKSLPPHFCPHFTVHILHFVHIYALLIPLHIFNTILLFTSTNIYYASILIINEFGIFLFVELFAFPHVVFSFVVRMYHGDLRCFSTRKTQFSSLIFNFSNAIIIIMKNYFFHLHDRNPNQPTHPHQ